jgi:hypothetical protein
MALVADAVHAGICRTFAVETAATGQREFIVTSAQRFWEHYTSLNVKQRHHYEIIRQANPCNLYFGEHLHAGAAVRNSINTSAQQWLDFMAPASPICRWQTSAAACGL